MNLALLLRLSGAATASAEASVGGGGSRPATGKRARAVVDGAATTSAALRTDDQCSERSVNRCVRVGGVPAWRPDFDRVFATACRAEYAASFSGLVRMPPTEARALDELYARDWGTDGAAHALLSLLVAEWSVRRAIERARTLSRRGRTAALPAESDAAGVRTATLVGRCGSVERCS